MFEQSILANGKTGRRVWTACLGMSSQAVLVAFAVVLPLVWPQALPLTRSWYEKYYIPTVPPPPPGPTAKPEVTRVEPRLAPEAPHPFTVPKVPDHPPIILNEAPLVKEGPVGVPGGVNLGSGQGVPGGFDFTRLLSFDRPVPVVRPPETRAATPSKEPSITRIRVSGLDPSKLLVCVKPVYPPLAKAAHIAGMVELEAVIAVSGRLSEIRVKSGHPLLVPAAVEAVRQWVYKPTYLNGDPVEVSTTIVVTFALNQ